MKIKITLKDPDGFYEAIREAAEKQVLETIGHSQLGTEELIEELIEKRHEAIAEYLKRWVDYGEYVSIEFDLDQATTTVIKQ